MTHLPTPGTKWIFFFQDTNGLAFLNLPALLGVSVKHELEVNSLAVPRMAKQVCSLISFIDSPSVNKPQTQTLSQTHNDTL